MGVGATVTDRKGEFVGKLEFREARPDDEDGILALAAESLGWGDDDRYRELYRWKHDRNCFGPSLRWVAANGDRIVGFRTMMRWRFHRIREGVLTAVRAVDTATAPDHQGRGIFRTLTEMAVEDLLYRRVDFVFNTPNDQSRPGYLKMGWVELGRQPVIVVPRLRSLRKIARSNVPADLWSIETDVGTDARTFFDDPDERWKRLWTGRFERWEVERSRTWCIWRYGLEPLHYRVLTAKDVGHGGTGAIVFRLRHRGECTEATVVQSTAIGRTRRRLVRELLDHADYVLIAGETPRGLRPAVSTTRLSPLVTWRDLAHEGPIPIEQFRFNLADLELF